MRMRRLSRPANMLLATLLAGSTLAAGSLHMTPYRTALAATVATTPTDSVTPPTATPTPTTTPTRTPTASPTATATPSATATPAPALAVAPASVTPGSQITITGSGFLASQVYTVTISSVTSPLATVKSTASGALPSTQVTIPYTVGAGQQTIAVMDAAKHTIASAHLTIIAVQATLAVAPSTTTPGGTTVLSGANFAPNEAVTITISGVTQPLTVIHAGASGALPSTSVTIPYTASVGTHTLTATGATSARTATATLTLSQVFATLAVTPTVTNRGGLLTVSGSNFAAGEAITISISGVITPLATITATAQGQLPPTGVSIPYAAALGGHTLTVTGRTSGRTAAAAITVQALAPSLTLSPTSAQPGTVVTVTGKGFGRSEQVTLALNGAALPTTPTVITTTNGAFSATFKAPASLLRNANAISAIGNQSRVSAVATLNGLLPVASTFYFAGASTSSGEQATLPVLNANAQPAHLDLTFYYQHGAPGHASLDVPAHSRATADLNALAGANRSFGLQLSADRGVSAQLHMARPGKDGFVLLGVSAPNKSWYLAEGYTGLTFHETLSLVNPGSSTSQVQLRLLPFGGRPARTVSVNVAPQSTQIVDVNSYMPRQSLSVIASASAPIIAERTLTFSAQGYGMTGKTGINTPATSWLFAEGTTTTRFQTFLTILNPNAVGTMVTASFYSQSGSPLGNRTIYVPALSRANIKLNDFLHASGIASVVTSNKPIVVERPEYFGSPNDPNVAGSDVFGRNGAGQSWTFPGGNTSNRNAYLLIYNPSAKTVTINATFYGSDGKTMTRQLSVPPTVRFNVNVNALVPGLAAQHGVTLRATNGLGFVAEQTLFAPNYGTLNSTQGFAQ